MPSNRAVYTHEIGTVAVDVKDAPNATVAPEHVPAGRVLIKAAAWASNPVDSLMLLMNLFSRPTPFGLGNDVAGTVVSVGPDVTNVKEGDRVVAFTFPDTIEGKPELDIGSAYVEYPVVRASSVFKIPEGVAFETAVVGSLTVATAALSLFHTAGLDKPKADGSTARKNIAKPKGTIFVYSGASSLGRQFIQLATQAGLAVVTTASKKNEEALKSLGANVVIDYKDSEVISKVIDEIVKLGFNFIASFDAYSMPESLDINGTIIEGLIAKAPELVSGEKATIYTYRPAGEEVIKKHAQHATYVAELVFQLFESDRQEFSKWLFNEYLQDAFASKTLVFTPEPEVVGRGINEIIKGINAAFKGIPGKKAVVLAE